MEYSDIKTKGHLAIEDNSLIGKCFLGYAYANGNDLEHIHVNTHRKFMEIASSCYGYPKNSICEIEVEIVEVYSDEKDYMYNDKPKAVGDYHFGCYECFDWDYSVNEFIKKPETITLIYKHPILVATCFSDCSINRSVREGKLKGVKIEVKKI